MSKTYELTAITKAMNGEQGDLIIDDMLLDVGIQQFYTSEPRKTGYRLNYPIQRGNERIEFANYYYRVIEIENEGLLRQLNYELQNNDEVVRYLIVKKDEPTPRAETTNDSIPKGKYETEYNVISTTHSLSAREYFMVLRLALYHIKGVYAKKSTDIIEQLSEYSKLAQAEEVYHCAVRIAKTMGEQ